jgi:flagellar assembly protein FliH
MKLSTKSRVVKWNTVEVCNPRLVENQTGGFQFLGEYISVVRDTTVDSGSETKERPSFEVLPGKGLETSKELSKAVKNWEVEVDTILNQAKEQAQDILAQAQAEAQKLQEEARLEIADFREKLKGEVTQQAYHEGYTQGSAQGFAEGKEQGVKEAEEIKAQAKNLLLLAQRAVTEEFSKVDEALLHLALKISERIVRANLHHHPDYLLGRIRALTLLPQEREGWRLHVAPQDAEWLMNLPPDDLLEVSIVRDETLAPGDCFLECQEGIFDSRLETQLDHFEHLLGEELKHDGLEQAGR